MLKPTSPILLALLFVVPSLAAPPASHPATKLTPAPAMEPLADGALRYNPPPGWVLDQKADNGLVVTYRTPDGKGAISIAVSPQTSVLGPSAAAAMAPVIGNAIRDWAKKNDAQVLLNPRVEPDDRFFLRLHDRLRIHDGTVSDRIQIYRTMGTYLVHVAVIAATDSTDEARTIHAAGEDLLDHMRVARGAHYTVFPRTQVKIKAPVDWREQKTDKANGLTATYNDPAASARQIIVRSRILPTDARQPGEKQTALLEKMVDEERKLPPFTPTAPSAKDQPVKDSQYLYQLRASTDREGQPLVVDTRYLIVGDVLLSVRSIAPESDAEQLAPIADRLAAGIKTPAE